MTDPTRRDAIKLSAAAAMTAGAGTLLGGSRPALAEPTFDVKPEPGAKLRMLRWKRFVQGDEDVWLANSKKYSETYGVEVRVDSENWEDVRPKAAVAANIGSGPDIIISSFDDPHKFVSKLVDLSDLAEHFDKKYGWYDVCKRYGKSNGKWIGLPMGAACTSMVYRKSHVQKAGFEEFPKDLPGFLKLCQGLQKNGTPAGFALGHATGDATEWVHWLLWGHGGKMVDTNNKVVLDSPETVAALEYAKQLYQTFIPGTLSWQDPNNNKAFLSGECSLTANGISVYYAAKNGTEPAMIEMAKDINHSVFPIGPIGSRTDLQQVFLAFVFKYCKYPNAAKHYLQFMWEKEQYYPWMAASIGYVTHPFKTYEEAPVWSSDPKNIPYRDGLKGAFDNGYSGQLGEASAACMAEFIIVDMFATACKGDVSAKEAAKLAADKAKRHYKA